MPTVSIIILSYNTREILIRCLEAIAQYATEPDVKIVVVDNASTDGSPEMVLQEYHQVQLIASQNNLGFAGGNNLGVRESVGKYILLLNSDAFLTANALQALLLLAEAQPRAGVIGAQLRNADGSFQASHTPFPTLRQEFLILSGLGRLFFGPWYPSRGPEDKRGPQMVDYVEGASMLIRRQAYEDIGGLDESYFMYAEDVELCYAMQQKRWQVWYAPEAKIIHLGGGSSQHRRPQREADLYRSRTQFFRRHYGDFQTNLFKVMLYFFTSVKVIVHSVLRMVSRGRYGRPVLGLRHLHQTLRKV
jgi:GT2 family glycosyltransferase